MISRIKLPLEQDVYSGLLKDAVANLRTPEAQAVYILRQHLVKQGLLQAGTSTPATSSAQPAGVQRDNA
jgi:hypothetical protein